MNQLLLLICKIIHAFQQERGSLCLYLSTKSENSKDEVLRCFQQSNTLISKLKPNISKELNQDQLKSYNKLVNIVDDFCQKSAYRDALNQCKLDIFDVIPFYTHKVLIHLTYVLIEIALFDKHNSPAEISAISNFINWKERIGRERALGVVGLAMNEFDSEQFTHDFNILLGEQRVNERSFVTLASLPQKDVFDRRYKIIHAIEDVHQQVKNKQTPRVSPQSWYQLVTDKMDMMHGIELELLADLDTVHHNKASNYYQHRIKDHERELILDFPFFRNLASSTINDIFKLSNLKTYKKGSLLFLEGEQASRIYVIISGWVKIFKSAPDGNESVEQMLSTGHLVIETAIFANDKYYNSAQISNEAKLLSFPAAIYRDLLHKDLALTLNSLKYLSQNSQNYLRQVDNNRLKSSKERVGWFLLKQFIEQKNPNTILLPYEKTIIASLLDMKPETFSRSLKSFKKSGLSSEKHQIQVEDIKMLCSYCDLSLAKHCQFKKTHDCKFNNKAD